MSALIGVDMNTPWHRLGIDDFAICLRACVTLVCSRAAVTGVCLIGV